MSFTRVLTSNIQAGTSAAGRRTNAEELAAAYDGVQVDVLALQEVDQDQHRSGRINQLQVIADALDLPHRRYAAAIGSDLRYSRKPAASIGDHSGPGYGVALASRYPVISWFTTRLPRSVSKLPMWQRGRLGWWVHEPRVALVAVLQGPNGPFAAATTHLSLITAVATWQLRTLLAKVQGLNMPAVVTGDFNLGAVAVARASKSWDRANAHTFPADAPNRQIDHILVHGGSATRPQARRLPISDHCALSSEVVWS